jgi:hypothetical protein
MYIFSQYIHYSGEVCLGRRGEGRTLVNLAELTVFGGGRRMVGQDVNALYSLAPGDKGTRRPDIFFIVIDTHEQGDANPDGMAVVAESLEVAEYQIIGNAGESFMDYAVHMFNVIEKKLRVSGNFQECFDRRKAAGIDCPVDAQPTAGLQECQQALRLTEWFPPRAGNASAALLKERQLFFYFGDDLGNAHTPPGCLMGESWANLDTGGAGGTSGVIPKHTRTSRLQGFFRAVADTFATAHAFVGQKENLRSKINPLRIMTPPAGQRTTFEKDCYPDVGAIMQCIPFDGKYVDSERFHVLN